MKNNNTKTISGHEEVYTPYLIHLLRPFTIGPICNLRPHSRGGKKEHIRAAKSANDHCILVYLSTGQPVQVIMDKLTEEVVYAQWFDPRNGSSILIGEFPNQGIREFSLPSSGIGNDWVLILK
ncbi:MAG: hypothetical protein ISS19_00985 [Bacteroidales bacterium]|nr:hypothetical protein [Bacteroidales bacterium]